MLVVKSSILDLNVCSTELKLLAVTGIQLQEKCNPIAVLDDIPHWQYKQQIQY